MQHAEDGPTSRGTVDRPRKGTEVAADFLLGARRQERHGKHGISPDAGRTRSIGARISRPRPKEVAPARAERTGHAGRDGGHLPDLASGEIQRRQGGFPRQQEGMALPAVHPMTDVDRAHRHLPQDRGGGGQFPHLQRVGPAALVPQCYEDHWRRPKGGHDRYFTWHSSRHRTLASGLRAHRVPTSIGVVPNVHRSTAGGWGNGGRGRPPYRGRQAGLFQENPDKTEGRPVCDLPCGRRRRHSTAAGPPLPALAAPAGAGGALRLHLRVKLRE